MWYTMTCTHNTPLNGGTQMLAVTNYGATTYAATVGTYTGQVSRRWYPTDSQVRICRPYRSALCDAQGDPTTSTVWGTTTPFMGFFGSTGG